MRAAVYLRVSTQDQSTDLQKSDLTAYAKARGFEYQIYEDKQTGTNGDRKALKRLLKDAKERKIDVVLCWKLDRFFRSLKDLVNTLTEFSEIGVTFISLKDNFDLTTSAGRLMMQMLGAFAEFEASLTRERVCAGLKQAKERGVTLGRPTVAKKDEVLRLKQDGLSVRQIAKDLHVSRGAVNYALKKAG